MPQVRRRALRPRLQGATMPQPRPASRAIHSRHSSTHRVRFWASPLCLAAALPLEVARAPSEGPPLTLSRRAIPCEWEGGRGNPLCYSKGEGGTPCVIKRASGQSLVILKASRFCWLRRCALAPRAATAVSCPPSARPQLLRVTGCLCSSSPAAFAPRPRVPLLLVPNCRCSARRALTPLSPRGALCRRRRPAARAGLRRQARQQ